MKITVGQLRQIVAEAVVALVTKEDGRLGELFRRAARDYRP